jgi:hypothetical protein
MKKIAILFSLGAAGFLFAIFFGLWARSLTTISESVHFSVNFPASAGNSSPGTSSSFGAADDCHDAGSPQQSLASTDVEQNNPASSVEQNNPASGAEQKNLPSNAAWNNYSVGGIAGTEGYVLIDLGQENWLKRLIQPRFVNLSTHRLRNVGTKPYKVRLEMNLCDLEPEWETPEAAWDQATQSSTRYIYPGAAFNMDWYLDIPAEVMQQAVICRGQLKVVDTEAGDLLAVLPINIFNSRIN